MSLQDEFVFSQREMPLSSFHTFETMRLRGNLCDINFIIENEKVSAHRVVLAANIPYFNELFLNNSSEDKEGKITFHEMMELDAFKALIRFAYTCEITINVSNARSLLIGSAFLKMDQIHDACIEFVSRKLNPTNSLETQKFAIAHCLVKLQEAAEMYVLKHFVEISHSEAFLDMSLLDLKKLISSDELRVTNEKEVFEAVIAWIKWLPNIRLSRLPELLTTVRMPLLGYHYLSVLGAEEELIKNSPACLHLLHEAKDYCILPEKKSRPCRFIVRHRNFFCCNDSNNPKNYLYAMCRFQKGLKPTAVARYDLMTDKWQLMNARTVFVKDAAVVVMDKKLYVIGGCNSIGRMLDAVQVYDPETDSWGKIASLQQRISQVAAAVHSDRIYVFGGKLEGDGISCYVECYNPERQKWSYLSSMYEYRRGACAVTANDCIYILGGYGYVDKTIVPLSSVEKYDVVKQEWSKISPMSMALCHFGATSINDRIYACGSKFVEFYAPWLKAWDRISDVKRNKVGFSLLSFQGKLYMVGGKRVKSTKKETIEDISDYENSYTIDIYDLETDKWSEGESLPKNINFIGAGAITED